MKSSRVLAFGVCMLIVLLYVDSALVLYAYARQPLSVKYKFETSWGIFGYSLLVEIPDQTYSYYTSIDRLPGGFYFKHFSRFVIPDSVAPIASIIASKTTGDREELADALLTFVHSVRYTSTDYALNYALYPIETLVLGGVCDDLSILYASLLVAVGFKVVFLEISRLQDGAGHMYVGVHFDNPPTHISGEGWFFEYDGLRYYVAETTGENWRVGVMPERLKTIAVFIEPVIAHVPAKSVPQISASATLTHIYGIPLAVFVLATFSGICLAIGAILIIRRRNFHPKPPYQPKQTIISHAGI